MSGPTGLGGLRAVCRRRPRLRTPEGRRRAVPDGGYRAFATIDCTMRWQMPTLADVLRARLRISPHLRPTPLLGYPTLNELLEADVFIKHENHQPVGAFKVRGGV